MEEEEEGFLHIQTLYLHCRLLNCRIVCHNHISSVPPPCRPCVARTTFTAVPKTPSATWQPPRATIPQAEP